MENVKETASELAALNGKMDIIIQHLSSINYLLLYGNRVDKDSHYDELNSRISNKMDKPKMMNDEELLSFAKGYVFGDNQEVHYGNSEA